LWLKLQNFYDLECEKRAGKASEIERQVQHKAKALALIKMLEREGPSLPFPYSSQVRGKLRELRTQQGKDKLRILYFGDANRVLVLLHGIVKRSAKLPEEDIRAGEARMELHNRRLEEKRK
jgi:hypothetical protein